MVGNETEFIKMRKRTWAPVRLELRDNMYQFFPLNERQNLST